MDVETFFKPDRPAKPDGLNRSQIARGTKRIPQKSQRRKVEDRLRDKRRAAILGRGCQACRPLCDAPDLAPGWVPCNGVAVDWHEIKTRGRGGSITDPANALATCRAAHDWVGAHPLAAAELGLVLHAWDDDRTVPFGSDDEGDDL